jgi:hypothetical protein
MLALGTKIKVTDKNDRNYNKVGKIIQIHDLLNYYKYEIEFKPGDRAYLSSKEFEEK